MIITIDGTVASGKSTVARQLAHVLGIYYINSGYLFRAVAYIMTQQHGFPAKALEEPSYNDIAFCLDQNRFIYRYDEKQGVTICFDGQDITPFLKRADIAQTASIMSTYPVVRKALLQMQRSLAAEHVLVVAEGRDAGSVVFPHADYKFFITASIEVRAGRWQVDQKRQGNAVSLDQAVEEVAMRDERDMTREQAPLVVPEGAMVIDTRNMTIEQVVNEILAYMAKSKRSDSK